LRLEDAVEVDALVCVDQVEVVGEHVEVELGVGGQVDADGCGPRPAPRPRRAGRC
jgi:hypothetical protein